MELRHIRYFIAVAEEGSFTRAAVRLRVAQQAVSTQISNLEHELGTELIERNAHGARLTASGRAFLEGATSGLSQILRAAARARDEARGEKLRVGHPRHALPQHLNRLNAVIGHAYRRLPGVALEIERLSAAPQLAALIQGRIDVGFCHLPAGAMGDAVCELFYNDPFVGVLLPSTHSLAVKDPLWLRDLGSFPFLWFSRASNPATHDLVLAALRDRGLEPQLALVDGVGIIASAVVASGGVWQLAPESVETQVATEPQVAFRRFADAPIPYGLCFCYCRDDSRAHVRDFVAICREMAGPIDSPRRPRRSPRLHAVGAA